MYSLIEINKCFETTMRSFENECGVNNLTFVSDEVIGLPFVDSAIKSYQNVIRNNQWYFPVSTVVNLEDFSDRWVAVHLHYFEVAKRIVKILIDSPNSEVLADYELLETVIRSETMRGWVGKRSKSGLDALLRNIEEEIESVLEKSLDMDDADELLSLNGVFIGNDNYLTAESEMVSLFNDYKLQTDEDEMFIADTSMSSPRTALLRYFCRYSTKVFDKKYEMLFANRESILKKKVSTTNDLRIVELMGSLSRQDKDIVENKFEELRFLNHLNLSLEVKYSFKGWSGLMHVAVIDACAKHTGVPWDVYQMHLLLKEK